jgi:coupling of ubiquitin conjugation to ER degradation protein 1
VSLIEKYGLTGRIPSRKGKEVDTGSDEPVGQVGGDEKSSGWSESREMREKALKERKERMILEARR